MGLDEGEDSNNENIIELKRALRAIRQRYTNEQVHLDELWCGEGG